MHATLPLMEISDFPAIRRRALETVQVNLGYRCNQSCVHCHVNAGPGRTENNSRSPGPKPSRRRPAAVDSIPAASSR